MGVPTDICLAHDLEPRYLGHLQQHFGELGMTPAAISDAIRLGKVAGDLLRVPFSRLLQIAPIDGICSGPPCPPWAGQGKKGSLADPRARVYLRLLEWVIYLVKMGGLLFALLENVVGIKQQRGGRMPTIDHFIAVLERVCPEFWWGVHTLHVRGYKCAQRRVRVFLKSGLSPIYISQDGQLKDS
jgi:site-specific DNA-cytosine methylase